MGGALCAFGFGNGDTVAIRHRHRGASRDRTQKRTTIAHMSVCVGAFVVIWTTCLHSSNSSNSSNIKIRDDVGSSKHLHFVLTQMLPPVGGGKFQIAVGSKAPKYQNDSVPLCLYIFGDFPKQVLLDLRLWASSSFLLKNREKGEEREKTTTTVVSKRRWHGGGCCEITHTASFTLPLVDRALAASLPGISLDGQDPVSMSSPPHNNNKLQQTTN